MVEVPRRLKPTPEERLQTIVSTVAPGSDQGSTLMARGVADGNQARAQIRSVAQTAAGDWVAVEPAASIAAKGHAYISFDPA